jgi:peptidoglycan/xylan/chitin deacetylase (PgdA/CDA1 family)
MIDDSLAAAAAGDYRADASLKGKLRRNLVRLAHRRPVAHRPDRPLVTFAFDDAPASATRRGAEILEARGLRGVYYLSAGLAGETGPVGLYATREDMRRVAKAGHEIGCHTYSHLDCGQATGERIGDDMALNAAMLADWGVAERLDTFAYPYGDVCLAAKIEASRRFALSRGLHGGLIEPGVDLNQAPAVGIEGEHGEDRARAWLGKAADRRAWLILYTHGVEDEASRYGATASGLGRLVGEALLMGFDVVSVAEGAARVGAAAMKAAA